MSGTNASALVRQGTLNRLRASVVIPSYPNLNVTAGYLGRAGITLALEGDVTQMLETMTGVVTSPEPFQMARVTIPLLRTQGLATTWRNQWESLSTLGQVTVHPDSAALGHFDFQNCAIVRNPTLGLGGTDPEFTVELSGIYYINQQLWNG